MQLPGALCGCFGHVSLCVLLVQCKQSAHTLLPLCPQVGQIGVLKFGGPEGAVPLHSLSQPFSDAAGPGIMSSLRFDQVCDGGCRRCVARRAGRAQAKARPTLLTFVKHSHVTSGWVTSLGRSACSVLLLHTQEACTLDLIAA
eukprot:915813-Pelagomonas_calceolata.AAC.1